LSECDIIINVRHSVKKSQSSGIKFNMERRKTEPTVFVIVREACSRYGTAGMGAEVVFDVFH
jgi:hypothetical protein